MDSVPSSGGVTAEGSIHAENIITGIQQQFTIIFQQPFTPPPDLVRLRTDYLTYLRDSYRYLDMQGIQQVQQVTQQLALTDVYVPLKAYAGHASAAGRVAGRPWSGESAAVPDVIAASALTHPAQPVPVEVALHTAPAVVVLGDPGSGKSTLLKVLALALVAQPDGPLPILLPLNAYARRLMQQGELSLSQFLGEYYASRQHKLHRVGELFHGDTEPARQAAAQERRDLLQAIVHNPSVERLAANPLLLTILALIKHTGVTLPEQRVKLYELYLQTLIESWNRARSLDQYPVGGSMRYEETIQVLAPLALWLRQENPTAGLVTRDQLEQWLTDYYRSEEWRLPRGEARQRGRAFLDSVQRYSNLLLERGERQYGFLHLTLEELLAAQGIVQRMDASQEDVLGLFKRYLLDPAWQETLLLAIGFIGVIQRRPRIAGDMLQELLAREVPANQADRGRSAIFAGKALLDMGATNLSRAAALKIEHALVQTMHDAACPIRSRRDAGDLLGRLGWAPDAQEGDVLLTPHGYEPTGLDAFRPVPGMNVWIGKYPVTNRQFARFIAAGGYDCPEGGSNADWAWRMWTYYSKASKGLRDPCDRPYLWDDRKWNSPLFPVVGITWLEAAAYTRWLSEQLRSTSASKDTHEVREVLMTGRLMVRLLR